MTEGLSAADVGAVTGNNGGFGGDGLWAILLLALLGRGGLGGYGAGGNCATPLDVRSAVDQSTVIAKLDGITNGISDATYALNNTIVSGFGAAELSRANMAAQQAACCCETQRMIERSTRDVIDNANCNTRAILDFLTTEKISSLRDENQTLKLAASQAQQNAYLINELRPSPIPAYITCNPYAGVYGCGCGNNGF
ncbi:MAG: hypothetical protein J6J21_04820 [Clostridia bacterium]|nr:hypothetical protein [Clostridia bacterium]